MIGKLWFNSGAPRSLQFQQGYCHASASTSSLRPWGALQKVCAFWKRQIAASRWASRRSQKQSIYFTTWKWQIISQVALHNARRGQKEGYTRKQKIDVGQRGEERNGRIKKKKWRMGTLQEEEIIEKRGREKQNENQKNQITKPNYITVQIRYLHCTANISTYKIRRCTNENSNPTKRCRELPL